ncbi:S8 family serine peptidase [Flavobacterium sp.]|jgi:hypothetical protein|uniref:S8 family serine peptidase n=1 Tax=Flavobacterium sp. TaxID=239 RepID=UPI0037C00168
MKSIFTISLIAVSFLTNGQTAEQREVIKSSMNQNIVRQTNNELKNLTAEKEQRIEAFLKNNPEKQKSFIKDGKIYSLYNVTKEGKPIYITTKDIPQSNNSKATSLYSGGSIGVNITGTSMVGGVWDGGQVNANHESLVGQATMQSGQSVNSAIGNDHQQAVTGIMVGKNTNNARGIAYGATTQNYDWDNDLTEMNDFANSGFLISNHSYGYANDNTTPVWTFGAYDSQSKAWDQLLKTKPFYLPFVAGGNEQQSSGNSGAGGFDIMTGSSSSKNTVTVGAINSDNSMSDYSNWGPTDDGRIKPDLVTLGTSIDVPLYANNTGYTGNVSSSSGTSYATPAAAAGALLLQQYYYSLNNSYMKASMLKALLLHSADDDASNNGPDSKFGWGILNLEKAANIIKQNSTTNGTAKMLMISSNPTNDGTNELVNNFIFGAMGVKGSLCWVDDEGIEQTLGDGVNNTTNRMVYNFSMKLEQTTPALSAFPYNNLSVTTPGTPAIAGNEWFQSANNYIQANLSGTTDNANGKVIIRKSITSPPAVREMALIITGLNTNNLGISDLDKNQNIVFFDKLSNKIKLISNTGKTIKNYQIYSIDGKLISSGNANSTEIEFNHQNKNIFILNYEIDNQTFNLKFITY